FLRVRSAEFVPTQRADLAINSRPRMNFRLPNGESRAGGILNYRHAPVGTNVKRFFHHTTARGDRLGSCVLGAGNGNIAEPVRRHSLLEHVDRQLVKTADILTVQLDDRVNPGGTHRLVFVVPTEKFLVKIFRSAGISSAELYPTKTAGFIFGEFLHSCFGHGPDPPL